MIKGKSIKRLIKYLQREKKSFEVYQEINNHIMEHKEFHSFNSQLKEPLKKIHYETIQILQYEVVESGNSINLDNGNFFLLIMDGLIKAEGRQSSLSAISRGEFKKGSMITDSEAKDFSKLELSFFALQPTLIILLPVSEFVKEQEELEFQRKRLLKVEIFLSKITGNQNLTLDENLASLFREKSLKKGKILTEEGKEGNTVYFLQEGICQVKKEIREENIELPVFEISSGSIIGEELLMPKKSKYFYTVSILSLSASFIFIKHSNLSKILSKGEIQIILDKLGKKVSLRNKKVKAMPAISAKEDNSFQYHRSHRNKRRTLGNYINTVFTQPKLNKSSVEIKDLKVSNSQESQEFNNAKIGTRSKLTSHRILSAHNPMRPCADLLLNRNIDPLIKNFREKGDTQLEAYLSHLNSFSRINSLSTFKNASEFDNHSQLKMSYERSIQYKKIQIERKSREEKKPRVNSMTRVNSSPQLFPYAANVSLQNFMNKAMEKAENPGNAKISLGSNIHMAKKEIKREKLLKERSEIVRNFSKSPNSYIGKIIQKIRSNSHSAKSRIKYRNPSVNE